MASTTLEALRQANLLDADLYRFALNRAKGSTGRVDSGTKIAPGAGFPESYGNRACIIESIRAEAGPRAVLVHVCLNASQRGDYNAGVLLADETGVTICGTNTAALGCRLHLEAGEQRAVDFELELNLARGRYTAYCEVVDEFSVCHRPLAGAEIDVEGEANAGVGLCRPLVKLRQPPD